MSHLVATHYSFSQLISWPVWAALLLMTFYVLLSTIWIGEWVSTFLYFPGEFSCSTAGTCLSDCLETLGCLGSCQGYPDLWRVNSVQPRKSIYANFTRLKILQIKFGWVILLKCEEYYCIMKNLPLSCILMISCVVIQWDNNNILVFIDKPQ